MTPVLIMLIIFAVSMISVAWVIPRKRAARISREAAEDAAVRDLYDHYLVGVDSLTQAYLLRAPSDDEWLAGIRAKAVVAARERRREVIWLPVTAALAITLYRVLAITLYGARARILYRDVWKYGHDDRETSWRNVRSMSLLVGILTAVASFCVLGHLAATWLLLVLGIVAPVALGVLAGHAIGLRSWLPGDPFEPGRESAHPSQIYDDRHGPGGKPGRCPGSTWSDR